MPHSVSTGDVLDRAVNCAIALSALVLLAPLLIIIAIAVKVTSPGPIIYRQTRVGLDRRRTDGDERAPANLRANTSLPTRHSRSRERGSALHGGTAHRVLGAQRDDPTRDRRTGDRRVVDAGGRVFRIYKFRTMRTNAESAGAVWASRDDVRVTPVGVFLRGTRLDEIPQLVNVLTGDMNIVGPRPERPAIFAQLRLEIDRYALRQGTKPGITGWAQINQGYDTSTDDVRRKVELDLAYIARRSIVEDLRIMARTLPVMILRKGAH
jgi:lipopolysaccharide/colanic/teichoic acid biosynthesis glycosyltransferase